MLRIKIETADKKYTVRVPQTPSEITARQMVLFDNAINEMPAWVREIKNVADITDDLKKAQLIYHCAELLEKVLEAPFTDALNFKGHENNANTVVYLQAVLYKALEYQPKKREKFTYKGQEYTLKYREKDVFGIEQNPKLTYGEAVLMLATKARYDQMEQSQVNFYNKVRTLLAILARKEGEKLPVLDEEIEAFIKERTNHFEDIQYDVLLDFWFFFRNL